MLFQRQRETGSLNEPDFAHQALSVDMFATEARRDAAGCAGRSGGRPVGGRATHRSSVGMGVISFCISVK